MNTFLIPSSVLVTLSPRRDAEADGSVWLCAVWWKTACQMRHGSINLGRWPLRAHRRDKWIHAATFWGRLDESAACQLLDWSSSLLLMNRASQPPHVSHLNYRSCANTSNTRVRKSSTKKRVRNSNGNCCRRQSERSLSSSLHWWSSLSLQSYTKKCR